MLPMILAAAMSTQVYADDFFFMKANEDFVMDSLPPRSVFDRYIPAELAEHVQIWSEDCWRCRRNANADVVKMGPKVIRWLFWPLRAKDLRVSMHANAVLATLAKCRHCGGDGECPGFKAAKLQPYTCEICLTSQFSHVYQRLDCVHCGGTGLFEKPEEEIHP